MKDRRLQSPFVEWEHHLVFKTSINTDDEKTKVQGGVCPKKASLHMLFSFCLYLNTRLLKLALLASTYTNLQSSPNVKENTQRTGDHEEPLCGWEGFVRIWSNILKNTHG